MKPEDSLQSILRGMIRDEIDRTPGFRELTSRSTLPSNIEAEKVILGAILLDNEAYNSVASFLCSFDFSLNSNGIIFQHISELLEGNHAVDLVTLAEKMGKSGQQEIGGVAYLASLTEGLPRRPAIEEYIRIVKEKARLRQIIDGCQDSIKSAQEQVQTSGEIVATLGIALKGIRKEAK